MRLNSTGTPSGVCTAGALLLASCFSMGILVTGCHDKKNDTAQAPREVEVATPMERDSVVVYTSYPATLVTESQADVVAQVNGQITKKYFQNGAYVKKGQPLFAIEPTIYAASVNESKAAVASALSQLDYAQKHLEALEQAYGDNAVARMDVIQARSARDEAQASVNQARAALTSTSTKLGYCTVVAPVSGRISAATVDVGAYVAGEAAPVTLATIYDESNLAAQFDIADYEYASITEQGDGFSNPVYRKVPVYITGLPDSADDASAPCYYTDVNYESPAVDPGSGNIRVKARFTEPSTSLRPGMYGKLMLPTGVVDHALLVNDASISTDQRGKYLYVVNDSDKVVYTPIEVGSLYDDTLRVVTKGLKPTDRYVTKAMINVRTGEKVKPVIAGSKQPSRKHSDQKPATRK